MSRPLSEAPPPPITAARLSTTPPPRPSEAGAEDSGIIDLNKVNAAATPAQVAAAEKAKPAAEGLFDEADEKKADKVEKKSEKKSEKKAEKKADKVASIAEAREAKAAKEEKKSGGGAIAGIVVALLGVAAAIGIVMMRKPAAQPTAQTESKPAVTQEAPAPKADEPKAAPAATPTGLSFDSLPTETAANDAPKPSTPSGGGPAVQGDKPATGGTEPAPANTAIPVASAGSGKPGDLASEMAKRVGGSTDQPTDTEGAEPAAGGKTGNQSIPEQPSQGKVQAAVGTVMPTAKSCVAGADDVSRASITFGSSGAVTSVNVTGWAASNGASGCVKNALKGANVGPFSKPSFTFSVTIRP
jgi:hypothetical protein